MFICIYIAENANSSLHLFITGFLSCLVIIIQTDILISPIKMHHSPTNRIHFSPILNDLVLFTLNNKSFEKTGEKQNFCLLNQLRAFKGQLKSLPFLHFNVHSKCRQWKFLEQAGNSLRKYRQSEQLHYTTDRQIRSCLFIWWGKIICQLTLWQKTKIKSKPVILPLGEIKNNY